MHKPPVPCSCVCPRPFSCTAGRALIRSWATGRGALRWVCTRLSLGEARHATLSSIPPTPRLSLSHPWRSRRCPYRPVVVVPVVCGPRRSAAIGPCGVARGCRPATVVRTCHTVAVGHSGGERDRNGGGGPHRDPYTRHSATGHCGHTAIITLHSPLHPPCSARSRPGTVGVICVTDCCECPLCRGRFFFDVFKPNARAARRRGRPAPAPAPGGAHAGGCGGRGGARCVDRTDRTCEATSKAATTRPPRHVSRGYILIPGDTPRHPRRQGERVH